MSFTSSNTAPADAGSASSHPEPDLAIDAPARGEAAVLAAIQQPLLAIPGAVPAARGLSHFGEHALGWMALAAAGAVVDRPHRRRWVAAGVGAFGAHAASVIIKRVVRRRRPNHPSIRVGVGTPSKLSFPSSHATSTTAAAVLMARATGSPLPLAVIPPMLASRLVLGVHYPTDVLAGAALGAASAAAVGIVESRTRSDRA